jgi:hypothetical protein
MPKVYIITDFGTLPGGAVAINVAGQIVAVGTVNGRQHVFPSDAAMHAVKYNWLI